jgi:hypothetical protein
MRDSLADAGDGFDAAGSTAESLSLMILDEIGL